MDFRLYRSEDESGILALLGRGVGPRFRLRPQPGLLALVVGPSSAVHACWCAHCRLSRPARNLARTMCGIVPVCAS